MMECMCCHHEFSGDVSRCPVCQFPVVYFVGGTGDEAVQKNARRYRMELLRDKKVSVVGYNWKLEQDEMKPNGKQEYLLATGDVLDFSRPVWLEQKFARNASRQNVKLTCRIHTGKQEEAYTVTLSAPKAEELWKVGVELRTGMKLRFLLQGGNETTCSDEVPLL